MRHVLCFGDSNTWGYIPGEGRRYDERTRWTGVLAEALGGDWRVHEDGLNARTSVFPSAFKPFLNGLEALPVALWSQKPLDVLVIALGTNDLKEHSAIQAATGVGTLVRLAQHLDDLYPAAERVFPNGPKILVVSPIEIGDRLAIVNPADELAGKHAESLRLPALFREMCDGAGVALLDAQTVAKPSPVDCVHMSPEGHRALGLAVAEAVRKLITAS